MNRAEAYAVIAEAWIESRHGIYAPSERPL
jgi:hypothetical protein